jgi:mannose-6-phosphate isomerase
VAIRTSQRCYDVTVVAGSGDLIDVPVGAKHRLANLGSEPLVIIEVQRGFDTGEDDRSACRHDYGRVE